MSDEVAIRVQDVSKSFKLPHEKHGSVKSLFVNLFRGRTTYEKQQVLKDVSFEIKKGEFFGIVGRNGSGKSTLLKLMSGIYSPDTGAIQVNGKLTPFIELGVGFNPDLTGRENIFLNGALLGFSREEMNAMYDEIVDFAELHKFMDQKLKNYSSGMQVRLAFSIAIRANSDILVLDEVLAVGDEAFQKKCYEYFSALKKEKKTVVLVSHDMNSVQRFCTRALYLDYGSIKEVGDTSSIASIYEDKNREAFIKTNKNKNLTSKINNTKFVNLKFKILNSHNKEVDTFLPKDRIILKIEFVPKIDIRDAFVGITIRRPEGELVYWISTEKPEYKIEEFKKNRKTTLELELQNIFGENNYSVAVSLRSNDRTKDYFLQQDIAQFKVIGEGKFAWMLRPNYKLDIKRD